MKNVLRRFADAKDTDCSPNIAIELDKYYSEFWGIPQKDYTEIKKDFNQLMMGLENELKETIFSAPDPLETALLYSRIANYIDFSAMSHVDKDKMLSMIAEENKEPLDSVEYKNLRNDLETAHNLVYLTDNCGEIVMDKIVIELLKEIYPELSITAIVRGYPSINDATMDDAKMCGLTEVVPVIGNGSDVCGTWLYGINEESRNLIENADVILSKGQGNYETLNGCGYNVYYLFLCKCQRFVDLFQAKLFQGMFLNDRRLLSD